MDVTDLVLPDGFSAESRAVFPILLDAGALAFSYFSAWHNAAHSTALPVEWKDAEEPVTLADRAVSDLCVNGLRAAFPHDLVISEEEPEDRTARLSASRFWLVDPIDGTKDFIAGRPGFSVMIGLVSDGVPVLGMVYQPAAARLWIAQKGVGAYECIEQETPRRMTVSSISDLESARMVSSASSPAELVGKLRDRAGIRDDLQVGSVGVKLCLIAASRRDLYVNPGNRCKLWDTAAPEIILSESGGKLTDLHGNPLRYRDDRVGHVQGLVASNGVLHHPALSVLSQLLSQKS